MVFPTGGKFTVNSMRPKKDNRVLGVKRSSYQDLFSWQSPTYIQVASLLLSLAWLQPPLSAAFKQRTLLSLPSTGPLQLLSPALSELPKLFASPSRQNSVGPSLRWLVDTGPITSRYLCVSSAPLTWANTSGTGSLNLVALSGKHPATHRYASRLFMYTRWY